MINFYLSICILIAAYGLNKIFIKNNFLLSFSGDAHQKFVNKKKVPLIGGILIFVVYTILFFQEIEKELFLLFMSVFTIGLLSDIKFFKSAIIKLILQIIVIYFFIYVIQLSLNSTRVYLIDNLNQNIYFNYLFVTFCIIILINGSNFIDGLNGLALGYFIIILLILHYNKFIFLDNSSNQTFFICLFIILILNLCNNLFLGDSGSYLLGIYFGYLLIDIFNTNLISPFFIILLLWYPCFELLFSIIRKLDFKKSPMEPDTNHLHQLIYYFFYKNFSKKKYLANNISSLIINFYNLIIFYIGSQNFKSSESQIILILISLILYCLIYRKLLKWKAKY